MATAVILLHFSPHSADDGRNRDRNRQATSRRKSNADLWANITPLARNEGLKVKRILITGMSGTGKSAVIEELLQRGYRAVDLDAPEWSHWADAAPSEDLTPKVGQDWVWREDRVRDLLSLSEGKYLFVSGCAENMGKVFDMIDTVVLLSAPLETVMGRLKGRSGVGYGQTAGEQHKVAQLIKAVEPLLRQSAHIEIDTQQPVAQTVDQILAKVA